MAPVDHGVDIVGQVRRVVPDVHVGAPRGEARRAVLSARSEPETRMPRSRNMPASPTCPIHRSR
jgi:hypothetical protein